MNIFLFYFFSREIHGIKSKDKHHIQFVPVRTIGTYGVSPGQLHDPRGIETIDDHIYVTDFTYGLINKFDMSGNYINRIPENTVECDLHDRKPARIKSPFDIAYHEYVGLLATDKSNQSVFAFNLNESTMKKFGSEEQNDIKIHNIAGIATSKSKGIIATVDTDSSTVLLFDINGKLVGKFGQEGESNGELCLPEYIAIDDNKDRIIVSDTVNSRVQIFDFEGQFLFKIGNPKQKRKYLDYPSGLAVDKSSNIFVADRKFKTVNCFNSDGEYVCSHNLPTIKNHHIFPSPMGLAVSNSNQVLACDTNNGAVQVFNLGLY